MKTDIDRGEIDLGSPFEAAGSVDTEGGGGAGALETALRQALAEEQFRLLYQPVIDVATDHIVAVEALLRWEHPAWGMLSPRRFIAAAEKSGLMVEIGDWAIRQACRDLQTWEEGGAADLRVDLGLSPAQFHDPRLTERTLAALAGQGVEPHRLCLEMTEATLLQDPEWAVALLRQCKDAGMPMAVADYGAGLLPMSELQRFALDRIKIGRLLTHDLETEDDDAAIVKAIVANARRLGLRSGAEGVESDLQCKLLRDMLCDEMQGPLFYRALSADQIHHQVEKGKVLADHLARLQAPQRTLLLVDDEENIVAALKRLLRRDGYQIFTANGGQEALELLKQHAVDVIVSDQRMPGMAGTEFLQTAKDLYPDTVRIMLSGYTELQSVTGAVNEGAIYKFLTKPWDDGQLRSHIAEAFRRKELFDENRRLTLEVRVANQELAKANHQLEELLRQKQMQIKRDTVSLNIVREALRHVPLPVIGMDEDGLIAFVNVAAQTLFGADGPLLGCEARQVMPDLYGAVIGDGGAQTVSHDGKPYRIARHSMGNGSESRGSLLILTP